MLNRINDVWKQQCQNYKTTHQHNTIFYDQALSSKFVWYVSNFLICVQEKTEVDSLILLFEQFCYIFCWSQIFLLCVSSVFSYCSNIQATSIPKITNDKDNKWGLSTMGPQSEIKKNRKNIIIFKSINQGIVYLTREDN